MPFTWLPYRWKNKEVEDGQNNPWTWRESNLDSTVEKTGAIIADVKLLLKEMNNFTS